MTVVFTCCCFFAIHCSLVVIASNRRQELLPGGDKVAHAKSPKALISWRRRTNWSTGSGWIGGETQLVMSCYVSFHFLDLRLNQRTSPFQILDQSFVPQNLRIARQWFEPARLKQLAIWRAMALVTLRRSKAMNKFDVLKIHQEYKLLVFFFVNCRPYRKIKEKKRCHDWSTGR